MKKTLIERARYYIENNNFDNLFKLWKTLPLKNDSQETLSLLISRYKKHKKDSIDGIYDFDQENRALNKIKKNTLAFLTNLEEELVDDFAPTEDVKEPEKEKSKPIDTTDEGTTITDSSNSLSTKADEPDHSKKKRQLFIGVFILLFISSSSSMVFVSKNMPQGYVYEIVDGQSKPLAEAGIYQRNQRIGFTDGNGHFKISPLLYFSIDSSKVLEIRKENYATHTTSATIKDKSQKIFLTKETE